MEALHFIKPKSLQLGILLTVFTLCANMAMAQIQPSKSGNDPVKAAKYNSNLRILSDTTNKNSNVDVITTTYTTVNDTTINNVNYADSVIIDTIIIDTINPGGLKIDTITDTVTRKTIVQAQVTNISYGKGTDTAGIQIDTILKILVIGDTLSATRKTPLDTIVNVTYIDSTIRDTIIANDTLLSPPVKYIIVQDTLVKGKVTTSTVANITYIDTTYKRTVVIDTISLGNATRPDSIILDTTIINAILTPRELPFFDDFSTTPTGPPPPIRWAPGGGTYVNNEYPWLPPSQNAVTFDGLMANGKPYTNSLTYGPVDTLTSWTIGLSELSPSDSVYLSFYWQGGGYGDPPTYIYNSNEHDSLALFFKDSTQNWQPVWSQRGDNSIVPTIFYQQIIGLKDSIYFHKNFQFRFVAYGPRFLGRSAWNLDYFILNSGRTYTDTTHPDITIMQGPGHALKNYTAMPADQFFANPANELADSIALLIKNWGSSGKYFSSGVGMTAKIDSVTVFPLPGATTSNPFPGNLNLFSADTGSALVPIGSVNNLYLVDTLAQIMYTKIKLQTPDTVVAGIDYRINDTITISTPLKDYFAYDDGVAEFPVYFNTSDFDEVAVQFYLNEEDTITALDIYFPQYTYNSDSVEGTDVVMMVWDSISVANSSTGTFGYENVVYSVDINLQYSALNQYVRYSLDTLLRLKQGKFYVGLNLVTDPNAETQIVLGYDANNSHPDKFFCRTPIGMWSNCSTPDYFPGSYMIRPVFSNKQNTPLAVVKGVNTLECSVYPNPTNGLINITGKVNNAKVYDVTGKLMAEQNFNSMDYSKAMNLQSLNEGLYLVHLSNSNASAVKKIIITK